jgi:hypothetical protein
MKTSICLIFTNAKTKLVEQHGWKMLLKLTFLFQTCFMIAGVNASFGQNGGAISATPNISSGCPTTQVKYTFSYSGSGTLRGREWSLSPSSAGTFPESNSGSSITVTWNASGSVVVNFAVQQGSQINSYSVPMSFSVTPASAGTIAGPSSLCYGGSGSFSISGNSSAVTWQRCTTGCSTNTDVGWTTTTNSFTNLTAATRFRAKLDDIACGVKYSNVITTTVSPVFYPGTIQGGGEYCSDQSITLSSSNAAGGGNGIIEYQWQQNRGGGFININAAGANQASYIVPAGQLASSYQRLAKDGVCQTSFVASNILLVSTPPALNANTLSAPTSICSGTSPGLITGGVPTGGGGGYQYTWQQSLDGTTWSLGVGVNGTTTVTSSSYDPPETLTSTMFYRRTVTSACGMTASATIQINVESSTSAGNVTGPTSVCYNGSGTLQVSGNSGGTVTFQRCSKGTGCNIDAEWIDLVSNSFTNLTVSTQFRAKLNNTSCGVQYSNIVQTNVRFLFTPGSINNSGSQACSNQSIILTSLMNASGGDEAISYQWQYDLGPGFVDFVGPGVDQASYTIPLHMSPPPGSTYTFRRLAKDASCQVSWMASNSLAVSGGVPLFGGSLMVAGGTTTICKDSSPPLITGSDPTGGGGGYQYTWQQSLDGTTWSLGVGVNSTTTVTSSSYDPPEMLTSTMFYRRTVTSTCGMTASATIQINVESTSAGTVTGPASVCYNGSGTLQVSGNSGGAVTFQRCSKGTGCNIDAEWIDLVSNSFTNLTVSTEFRAKVNNLVCGVKYSPKSTTTVINPRLSGSLTRPAIASGSVFSYLPISTSGSTFAWSRAAIVGIVGAASGVGSVNERLVNSTKTDITVVYVFLTTTGGCTGVAQRVSVVVRGALLPNENYIISNTLLRAGVTNENLVNTMPVSHRNQTIQYFDGLGRPMQTVNREASPSQQDMVQTMVYDPFGRESKKYLPVVINTKDGWYKSNLIDLATGSYTNQALNFYNNTGDKIADDLRPYSETIFEASPLNRPDRDYGVGKAWAPQDVGGNNKFLQHGYQVNQHSTGSSATEEKVIAWIIDSSGELTRAGTATDYVVGGGYYASGQLSIKSTKDEEGNEVREYTNKDGRVILKKVQATSAGATNLNDPNGWALTYYVYDYLGNLAIVLPPEAVKILEN